MTIKKFQELIYTHYKKYGRALPWRTDCDPYRIFISEVMLQQTQVARGLVKFPEFISIFPSCESLARASTTEVLRAWQGLGYNRRALYLKRAAEIIVRDHSGVIPRDIESLRQLPGIGPNTAASIAVFAYNSPQIFIETNIRTVFLHHFFRDQKNISDKQLMPLIKRMCDRKNPREWYWALMDYGTLLKKEQVNPSRRSQHYTKQSRFEGSVRQLRGQIIKLLIEHTTLTIEKITCLIPTKSVQEIKLVMEQLHAENFVGKKKQRFFLVA